MFDTLNRSWSLTRTTFTLIGKDKEMLLFPLLAGISSVVFFVALVFPWLVLPIMQGTYTGDSKVADAAFTFVFYLGTAFVSTFFNVCVVNTVKVRLEGGDATFMDSIRFALSRLPQIAGWSLVSATVGMFLYLLDQVAERAGVVGQILMRILISLMGAAWSIVSMFVIPVMVYEGKGPLDALKSSVETIKKTWGEALVGHWGMGLVQFLVIFPTVLLCFLTLFLAGSAGGMVLGGLIFFWLIVILVEILVFTAANTVFRTALFHYASTGEVPTGYESDMLQGAFREREAKH